VCAIDPCSLAEWFGRLGHPSTGILDSPKSSLYNAPRSIALAILRGDAQVAQLVEHVTENHGVGGSIPPLGTIKSSI
jgi:hypothetical protein